ncbi:MAG: hypothetical protein AB2807_00485 [Candidatus Sedimenticola endophacoides]
MLPPKAPLTTALIAALVALGPLATDMYLPAFPTLMREFGVGIAATQQTLSVFLVGFALAQLIYGPLRPQTGTQRRPAAVRPEQLRHHPRQRYDHPHRPAPATVPRRK